MMTLSLDSESKARIWLGEEEFPAWQFRALYQSEYRLDTRRRKFPYGKRAAAVELLRSQDGKIEYGALGATFNPRQVEWLTTYISSTHAMLLKVLLADTLARGLDTVYVGLAERSASGIYKALEQTDAARLLGAGTLRLQFGAFGKHSSSVQIFAYLTNIVLQLLVVDPKTMTERRALNLLKRVLQAPAVQTEESMPDLGLPDFGAFKWPESKRPEFE